MHIGDRQNRAVYKSEPSSKSGQPFARAIVKSVNGCDAAVVSELPIDQADQHQAACPIAFHETFRVWVSSGNGIRWAMAGDCQKHSIVLIHLSGLPHFMKLIRDVGIKRIHIVER